MSEPEYRCQECGKVTAPGSIHTCSPQVAPRKDRPVTKTKAKNCWFCYEPIHGRAHPLTVTPADTRTLRNVVGAKTKTVSACPSCASNFDFESTDDDA